MSAFRFVPRIKEWGFKFAPDKYYTIENDKTESWLNTFEHMVRNKVIIKNEKGFFKFLDRVLILLYQGNTQKEATVIIHIFVSKDKQFICYCSKNILLKIIW